MSMIKKEFEAPSDLETVVGYDIVDSEEELCLRDIKPLDPNLHITSSSVTEGNTASCDGLTAPVKLEIGNPEDKGCSVASHNASGPSPSIPSHSVPESDEFKFSISDNSNYTTIDQHGPISPVWKRIDDENCMKLKVEPSSPTEPSPTLLNEETIVIHSNIDDLVSGNADLENDIAGKPLYSNNTPSMDSDCKRVKHEPTEGLLVEQQSRTTRSNKPTVEQKQVSEIMSRKLISDTSRTKQKGKFACRICLKNYVLFPAVKKHMFQKHPQFRDFCALVQKDNKGSDNDSQLLWFCPRNCKYLTSEYNVLSEHLIKCVEPDLLPHFNSTDNVETRKNLRPLEYKEYGGDTSAGGLMVHTQQTGLALDYEMQTVDQDLNDIPPTCQLCDSAFSTNLLLEGHMKLKDCHKEQDISSTTHTGEKPFKSTDWDKSFSQSYVLNIHGTPRTGGKPFKCSHCNKSFSRNCDLHVHMRTHTEEKPFKCSHCNKSFSRNCDLHVHMRTHTGEKPFKCSHCNKSFCRNCDLHVHMRTHTGEKPFKCSHCNKSFSRNSTLHVHMKRHTGEKHFKCNNCNMMFSHGGDLHRHMRIHTREKPFKCSHCNKSFSQNHHLYDHIRTHTGEKPFKCSHCNKSFIQNNHLHVHMRTHTGEKPFKCSHCNKSFSRNCDLHVHMRTQTGENPFKCSHCNKSFRRNYDLHMHMRTHTGEKPFKCSHCNKSFSRNSTLHVHMRIHTGEKPFKCNNCNMMFSHSGDLHRHMRIHTREKPFKCSHCNKSFSRSHHLHVHIRTHTREKPFKRSHCNKSFHHNGGLHRHMRTHTREKPFKCSHCNKSFSESCNLCRHMKTYTGAKNIQLN